MHVTMVAFKGNHLLLFVNCAKIYSSAIIDISAHDRFMDTAFRGRFILFNYKLFPVHVMS